MFVAEIIYTEFEEKFEFNSHDEAHDFAMDRYFWGALGFYITDPNGDCVECYA